MIAAFRYFYITIMLGCELDIAKIDRVGCFKYENVEGARAQNLKNHVPEDIKNERFHRFMS